MDKTLLKHNEEHALETYKRRVEEWNRISENISRKIGVGIDELLINKIEEYRDKIEEFDLMDMSIPPHIRHGINAWELSLRGGLKGAGGIRYVQLGSSFPYPLYCPVYEVNNKQFEMIRKPNAKITHSRGFKELLSTVRTYSRKNYKKYLTKILPYDPKDEIKSMIVTSSNSQQKRLSDEKSVDDERSNMPVTKLFQDEEKRSLASTSKDDNRMLDITNNFGDTQPQLQGPNITLNMRQIIFRCATSCKCKDEIIVNNTGCVALFYQLTKQQLLKDKVLLAKKEQDGNRFQLSTPLKGTILPGDELVLPFTFSSDKEGIFTDNWTLSTVPSVKEFETINIRLRATVINENESDIGMQHLQEFQDRNNASFVADELVNTIIDKVDSLAVVEEEKKEEEVQAVNPLTEELFYQQNKGLKLYYHENIMQSLLQLAHNVFKELSFTEEDSKWDYSLNSLGQLIQAVGISDLENGLKQRNILGRSLQDMITTLSYPVPVSDMKNVREEIFYYIGVELLNNCIDEIAQLSPVVHEEIYNPKDSSKSSKKPKKAAKKKPPPTTTTTEEAIPEEKLSEEEIAAQKRKDFLSLMEIKCKTLVKTSYIDRFIELCDETQSRFEWYVSHEQNEEHEVKVQEYEEKLLKQKGKAANNIQRMFRGHLGRTKFKMFSEERQRELELQKRLAKAKSKKKKKKKNKKR